METNPSLLIIIAFFLHCLMPLSVTARGTNITTDQDALLSLKAHITHDPNNLLAKNWSTNSSICNWIGFTCGGVRNHRVTALNISYLGLGGTIPSQLGQLSSLQILDVSNNEFSGIIPSSIFNISTLESIDFSVNQFSGSFPSIIFNLSSLSYIDLSENRLSGGLPENVFSYLPNLETLFLFNNELDGEIPTTLSECKELQYLALSNNYFTGAIPKQIGNLTKMKTIYLGGNKLQGEIPQELGNLVELELLSLLTNGLTGTIPSVIFNLSSLTTLHFTNNSLTGTLPDNICQHLPFLEVFGLSLNQFTGPIPYNLWQCRGVRMLSLSFNQFTGSVPRSIGNLTLINELYLGYNKLIGEIPEELGNLIKLEKLSLPKGALTGSIPSVIFNLSSLIGLDFSNNSLRGGLPNNMCQHLPVLEGIFHGKIMNYLVQSRTICGSVGSFVFLTLEGNQFTGSIPRDIGNLTSVTVVYLGFNHLTGEMPNEIGNLPNLEQLRLNSNNFIGSVPTAIFNISTMIELSLADNKLSGILPPIIELPNLERYRIQLFLRLYSQQSRRFKKPPVAGIINPAHLSDFGTSKLLSEDESMTQTQTLATIGYMAPVRKKPTDEIFAEERSLKQLVSESLRSSVMEVVDKNLLWREDEHFAAKECASSIMSLAMECTEESPKKGINTKVMVPKLLKIRDTLLANLEMVKGRRGSKLN
ncbi:hypothetical protein Patl1_10479 [Pistacia atlantica]|uniref:Uncharacterized protein n=1 Tax=Pistacia atlantica TaxID=434234 RepID=A0ACC1A6G3_9ROSI|nr:hypothetical protein Patl1_10479 [Pistacia atlantica]